jgi:DNA-binding PadR family transcriptional regulator
MHGFALATELRDRYGAGLTAHGTLYKALARLAYQGLLTARWEQPVLAEAEGRPRRRLYRITDAGRAALVHASTGEQSRTAGQASARPIGTRRPVAP